MTKIIVDTDSMVCAPLGLIYSCKNILDDGYENGTLYVSNTLIPNEPINLFIHDTCFIVSDLDLHFTKSESLECFVYYLKIMMILTFLWYLKFY